MNLLSIKKKLANIMSPKRITTNLDKLLHYYNEGNWKKILAMFDDNQDEEERFYDEIFLWIRPKEDDLLFIGEELKKRKLHNLLSIGCGTGLLEWMLLKATDLNVSGLEIDRGWWENPYAPPIFISLCYVDEIEDINNMINEKYALLFCYFNNEKAFKHYINIFRGKCFIVIGPGKNNWRHTCPAPFMLPSHNSDWVLGVSKEVSGTGDFIAFYDKR